MDVKCGEHSSHIGDIYVGQYFGGIRMQEAGVRGGGCSCYRVVEAKGSVVEKNHGDGEALDT